MQKNALWILSLLVIAICTWEIGIRHQSKPDQQHNYSYTNEVIITNFVMVTVYETNTASAPARRFSQRGVELAAREMRATESAERRAEEFRREYVELFSDIGVTGEAVEVLLKKFSEITQRAFMSEARIIDLMKAQDELKDNLAKYLTPEQLDQFVVHEKRRPVDTEAKKMRALALENGVYISDETMTAFKSVLSKYRQFTSGPSVLGPLDSTPIPAIGVDGCMNRSLQASERIRSMRDTAKSELASNVNPLELNAVVDYYDDRLKAEERVRQNLIDTPTKAEAVQIGDEINAFVKAHSHAELNSGVIREIEEKVKARVRGEKSKPAGSK